MTASPHSGGSSGGGNGGSVDWGAPAAAVAAFWPSTCCRIIIHGACHALMRPSDERCSPRVFIEVPFQLHICDCGTIGDQCSFLSVAGFIDALARELHWVTRDPRLRLHDPRRLRRDPRLRLGTLGGYGLESALVLSHLCYIRRHHYATVCCYILQ